MIAQPQAIGYTPDPAILPLAPWLGDKVAPAPFPQTMLRWANHRWAQATGLDKIGLDPENHTGWIEHFARFTPLPANLPHPLALRYHGHQFGHYNPDLGDGRGFLFAQLRDGAGRLLDLGTKGSGQTPWSRQGDGRLTLKGAVREILATEMLEALGVNTSKSFCVIETGEALERGDEPSPTRSAVLTRLSHGHIRFGTFQRLFVLEEAENMAQLVEYCLGNFPAPPDCATDANAHPAVQLLEQVVARMADLAASYTTSGFVHGVLNTDNMNISGESFDYGPWRWLPRWDAGFTAAYFDHAGRYAFGRQAQAIGWNCGQLAIALRLLAPDTAPLIAALDRFEPLYQQALAKRTLWRLGLAPLTLEENAQLLAAAGAHLQASGQAPCHFFHRHRGGRNRPAGDFGEQLARFAPLPHALEHDAWHQPPPDNLYPTVEQLWAAIDQHDNWQPLYAHIERIRHLGEALGGFP